MFIKSKGSSAHGITHFYVKVAGGVSFSELLECINICINYCDVTSLELGIFITFNYFNFTLLRRHTLQSR